MSNDDRQRKPKLVRDSFTIPKSEFAAIDALKTRAIGLGTTVKKSELLRAGLMLLVKANDAAFKAALAQVPSLKTGRPPLSSTASAKNESEKPASPKLTAAAPSIPRKASPPKAPVTKTVKPVVAKAKKPVSGAVRKPRATASGPADEPDAPAKS